jgi:hypothetical protein
VNSVSVPARLPVLLMMYRDGSREERRGERWCLGLHAFSSSLCCWPAVSFVVSCMGVSGLRFGRFLRESSVCYVALIDK